MSRIVTIFTSIVLILHGLVHLMGAVVYMKLVTILGLEYKTILLDGRWDLGERGMWVFGLLWAVAGIGFVLAAIAWLARRNRWQSVLMAATLLSLMLTLLDWRVASAGAIVNIVILLLLWLRPRITSWAATLVAYWTKRERMTENDGSS